MGSRQGGRFGTMLAAIIQWHEERKEEPEKDGIKGDERREQLVDQKETPRPTREPQKWGAAAPKMEETVTNKPSRGSLGETEENADGNGTMKREK